MYRSNPHLMEGIPSCIDCSTKLVRWRDMWVCRQCFPLADAMGKQIPLGSVLMNRAQRRASS